MLVARDIDAKKPDATTAEYQRNYGCYSPDDGYYLHHRQNGFSAIAHGLLPNIRIATSTEIRLTWLFYNDSNICKYLLRTFA